MLPICEKANGLASASSLRVRGLPGAARTAQRSSVIVCVRKKFMTEERWNDSSDRFSTPRSRSRASTRLKDRFAVEEEEETTDVSWNGYGLESSNGNGASSSSNGKVASKVASNGVSISNGNGASLSNGNSLSISNGNGTRNGVYNKVAEVARNTASPRSPGTPRQRRGSPSRFESGMERLSEPPTTSAPISDITERFMSRARERPSAVPPKPAAPVASEPKPSFVAAERARSPDPMRPRASISRTASRGRVRDRFMDPPSPPKPAPAPPPPPPVRAANPAYATPQRPSSRTPSPIRRNRMGPTAQRLALISQEATSARATPATTYIDVEAVPTSTLPWASALPALGQGIPFLDIMAFNGAGPETINGRLAMLGFFSMLCTEFATGETLLEQLAYTLDSLPYMFALWTAASLVPLLRGADPAKTSWGPFTPTAEKWNGRGAMIGIIGVIVFEALKGRALFF